VGKPFIDDLEVEWRGSTAISAWQRHAKAPLLIDAPFYFQRVRSMANRTTLSAFVFNARGDCVLRPAGPAPEVVHCNDCLRLRRVELARPAPRSIFSKTRSVFSIHNLLIRERSTQRILVAGFLGIRQRFMVRARLAFEAGIIAADALSTVSPRYAREFKR